jgi:hypothetical protein
MYKRRLITLLAAVGRSIALNGRSLSRVRVGLTGRSRTDTNFGNGVVTANPDGSGAGERTHSPPRVRHPESRFGALPGNNSSAVFEVNGETDLKPTQKEDPCESPSCPH